MLSASGILVYMGLTNFAMIAVAFPIFLGCVFEKLPILANRGLVYAGTVSYPIYLIHQNIAFEVEFHLMNVFDSYNIWIGMAGLIAGVTLGLIIYYFVEQCRVSRLSQLTKSEKCR